MRVIKFRVWDKSNYSDPNYQKMHLVSGISWSNKKIYCEGVNEFYMEDMVLMQFTGLKDKNGKEIYEGDICWHPKIKIPMVIEWQELNDDMGIVGWGYADRNFKKTEVIGNIYENPELIK